MDNLLKMLSNILDEEKSKEEKDRFKNLTDLYRLCVSKGYMGDMEKFKSEYTRLVEQCSNMLKTSEISDLDLESVAGGVNINVSLKSSIAMIMGALSLSGSASGIASAANPKLNSNNSSISNKVNTWDRSKSNLTNGQVLSAGLGAAVVGTLGGALVSIPIAATMAASIYESGVLYNAVRLVYSLNATNSESVSFDKLNDNEKRKLIKSAYSELDIKLDKTTDISKESVRTTLLSKLNEQIAKLDKNSKSKEVQLRLSRLGLLKMCLETKSNVGLGGRASSGATAPGADQNVLTDKEQRELDDILVQLEGFERNANSFLEKAQKNRDLFKGGNAQADAYAEKMLDAFVQQKNKFVEDVIAQGRVACGQGDLEGARRKYKEALEERRALSQKADGIAEADRRARDAGIAAGLRRRAAGPSGAGAN